ncbi:hypothetical protein BCR24_09005 [Enterococcus ureilyticus]|uniref:50S ribosomal protein L29 n=2 Tax=Enterococcus TaxID=1350 RepID=A0A0S3K8R7_9ENTE|nr:MULTISPECIES: hypothetical protein [Enterococcus]OTP53336.1 hypothetical protein A5881_000233 [Enterococcus termitis]ALS00631.1 hypothetical protein ATZ33_04355 [Enterococcus silesiacus]MBM7688659.1 hypothetical protein [Enterococcus ureilyticus]MBO0447109.1 hypothetical protein [Enterococcus ureilyticus]OEG21209.1 hypothetical protein BCR24_09005 [Enterococcus ureilyticus]
MSLAEERLQKEKMKQVQLLAAYYQVVNRLPLGVKRDQMIRDILACKDKIKKINQQLTELNKKD